MTNSLSFFLLFLFLIFENIFCVDLEEKTEKAESSRSNQPANFSLYKFKEKKVLDKNSKFYQNFPAKLDELEKKLLEFKAKLEDKNVILSARRHGMLESFIRNNSFDFPDLLEKLAQLRTDWHNSRVSLQKLFDFFNQLLLGNKELEIMRNYQKNREAGLVGSEREYAEIIIGTVEGMIEAREWVNKFVEEFEMGLIFQQTAREFKEQLSENFKRNEQILKKEMRKHLQPFLEFVQSQFDLKNAVENMKTGISSEIFMGYLGIGVEQKSPSPPNEGEGTSALALNAKIEKPFIRFNEATLPSESMRQKFDLTVPKQLQNLLEIDDANFGDFILAFKKLINDVVKIWTEVAFMNMPTTMAGMLEYEEKHIKPIAKFSDKLNKILQEEEGKIIEFAEIAANSEEFTKYAVQFKNIQKMISLNNHAEELHQTLLLIHLHWMMKNTRKMNVEIESNTIHEENEKEGGKEGEIVEEKNEQQNVEEVFRMSIKLKNSQLNEAWHLREEIIPQTLLELDWKKLMGKSMAKDWTQKWLRQKEKEIQKLENGKEEELAKMKSKMELDIGRVLFAFDELETWIYLRQWEEFKERRKQFIGNRMKRIRSIFKSKKAGQKEKMEPSGANGAIFYEMCLEGTKHGDWAKNAVEHQNGTSPVKLKHSQSLVEQSLRRQQSEGVEMERQMNSGESSAFLKHKGKMAANLPPKPMSKRTLADLIAMSGEN